MRSARISIPDGAAEPAPQRPWIRAATRAGLFTVALLVIHVLAVLTRAGQAIDDHTFPFDGGIDSVAANVFDRIRTAIPLVLTVAAVVVGTAAVVKRRWREALAGALALVGVYVTAEFLRDVVLLRPDYGLNGSFGDVGNTYPSRHVAFALTAAIVVMRLLPGLSVPARRLIRATTVLAIVGVALASIAAFAHRWSDVVGGALLAAVAGCCLSAADSVGRRTAGHATRLWVASAAVIVASAALAIASADVFALAGLTVGTAVLVAMIAWAAIGIATANVSGWDEPLSLH